MSWTAETGKSYRVEREAAYLFKYRVWQTIADNQSSGSVTESGLPCGTYYVYRVRGKGVDSSYGASKLVLGPAQSCTSAKGSGTRDVRAPDTEVRKLRLVTDLPTQTSIRIRLLFHRKMDETDLTYTPVSGMKKYRVDRTQRLAPLTVPLPIHWPKPTLESGYRMEQYVSEFDWTGLHCGSNYFFRALGHGNGADFLHDWGNHWSNAVHGSTRGCTKPQVDVIPLPQRKARLRWNNINGASSYEVRVAKPGEAMGNKVPQGCNASYAATGSATAYQCDILLDNIVDNEGLAHVSAGEGYRIRVTVHFTDTSLASQYSDVILLDSPIRSVNGDSRHVPENKGKMVVKWRPAVSISTAHYTVRWRKLRGRHAGQVFWSPISWIEGDRNSEYDWQVGATTTADSATYESENLKRGEIYAVQLNYTLGADQYYSAREAYVWVSARAGGVYGGGVYGELIGGMPLGRALDDILAPDYRTYFYRICEDTINPVSQRSDWAVLIEAALEEWELATDGMVVMTLDGYTAAEVASNPNLDATKVGKSKPCAQYTQVINDIRVEVEIELAATTEETVSREIIERVVSNLHYHADFLNEDLRYNEIIMYDDRPTANAPVEFSELGGYIGFFWCGKEVPMCAYTPEAAWSVLSLESGRLFTYPFHTRDIAISQSYFEANDEYLSVSRPDVTFNVCTTLVDFKYYTYFGIVHEGGHVLGIVRHPAQRDSVMNGFANEPVCSPHPLDIMAIYALYQSRD